MNVDHTRAAAAFALLVLALAAYAAATGGDGLAGGDELDVAEVEALVAEAVDSERAERGLQPLDARPALADAARQHSGFLADEGEIGHSGPGGETIRERYAGVCAGRASENVASTWHDRNLRVDDEATKLETPRDVAEHVVGGWMDSPGHRDVLLDADWTYTGVGVDLRDDGRVFVTQAYCAR